jgi:hypothetical protein
MARFASGLCVSISQESARQKQPRANEGHVLSLPEQARFDMTVPFNHAAKTSIEPLPAGSSISGKRRWLDDHSPAATIKLAALLMVVWMGALILFALLLARRM